MAYKEGLLKEFINEAREHLEHIEEDLLNIEESGVDMDEDTVNKVFRAAHSIKGGCSFLGLNNIKSLAHAAETVLDMLRCRRIEPDSEVINTLLAAFDRLREMINNVIESDKVEVEELLQSLTYLTSKSISGEHEEVLRKKTSINNMEGLDSLQLTKSDLDRVAQNGMYIYSVLIDLSKDIEEKGMTLHSFIDDCLGDSVELLDCAVNEPDGDIKPVQLVVATAIKPDEIEGLFSGIEKNFINLIFDPCTNKQDSSASKLETPSKDAQQKTIPSVSDPSTSSMTTEIKPKKKHEQKPRTHDNSSSESINANINKTLRINVNLLETLMNLAGELVLSRNQLRTAVEWNSKELLSSADQRINQVTSELQDVIIETRLQPIGNVFSKFPRIVRDISKSHGKEIQLDIRGKEVALDKTVLEGISDPLTHMVRNSVDHGIETPRERLSAGKNASGTIRIEAFHESGQVVVEIADDGRGIDPDRVAASAVSKGLISEDKLQGLSDVDKQAMVLLPGLSTADRVSDVSGRGVGMDVVKTNIDRLGGQMELFSQVGKGSTFRIKLPLTLAIIPSLIISEEDQLFAIPQANIEELLRLRPEQIKSKVEIVGDREVLLLRDRILPLVRFADVIGIVRTYTDPETGIREIDRRTKIADRRSTRYSLTGKVSKSSEVERVSAQERTSVDRRCSQESILQVAVVTTGTMSFGLVVKKFNDTEEVVVKPLGSRFKGLHEYSGATILGNGSVAMILDVGGLAVKAGVVSVSGSARAAELSVHADVAHPHDLHTLLLFNNSPAEYCAIPMDLVRRIERISSKQVEVKGGRRAMQYCGGSLPLVALSDTANVASLDSETNLVVLVASTNGREVGLLGAPPVDVFQTYTSIDQVTHRQKGISGSAIINNNTTLIADIYEIVDELYPEWNIHRLQSCNLSEKTDDNKTVLLAEDSDFFRSQIKRYMEESGLKVLEAPDGESAWELIMKNLDEVCMVVTDIEMPRLTGLELTSRIRADERTAKLPVIAVTSLAGDDDIARGIEAGVNEYQIKLDRDKLMESVMGMLVRHPAK